MKLEFDSISEMEQFLMFSAHIGRAFAAAPRPTGGAMPSRYAEPGTDTDDLNPNGEMPDEEHSAEHRAEQAAINEKFIAATVAENAEAAKPKRTRRTKAEIEAERAANVADGLSPAEVPNVTPAAFAADEQSGTSATTVAGTVIEQSTPVGANPFAIASPATQAILEAPNQSAATLAGIAAMQTPPGHEQAEQPAAPRVIESIEHLRACQSFIQAHGMARYNESFKDGLNANIAAYTPEQRAQHVAILSTLGV